MADIYPNQEIATENLTGDISFLDDESTGWYEVITNDGETVLRVGFPAPESNLDGEQTIRVWSRRTDESTRIPTLNMEVFDGETSVAVVDDFDVNSTTGEAFFISWQGSGAGTEIEILLNGTRTGGPSNQRNTVEFGGVEWQAVLAEPAQDVFGDIDLTSQSTVSIDGAVEEPVIEIFGSIDVVSQSSVEVGGGIEKHGTLDVTQQTTTSIDSTVEEAGADVLGSVDILSESTISIDGSPDVVFVTPTGLQATDVTETSITWVWDDVDDAHFYELQLQRFDADWVDYREENTTLSEVTTDELEIDTNYRARVRAARET